MNQRVVSYVSVLQSIRRYFRTEIELGAVHRVMVSFQKWSTKID